MQKTRHPGRISKLSWPIAAIVAVTPNLLSSEVLAQGAGALEEIVVTAQRREEAIQDVPISITAFGTEDLQTRNIDNVENMNMLIPNVVIRGGGTTGPSDGNFTMRGVPGVARYLDGVAQTSSEGALSNVIELQRIEVLKGPQGTLFGKNAMGGAISYVSQEPRDVFGARVELGMGNFNQRRAVANIDIPLSNELFTKLTFANSTKEGYVQSGLTGIKHGDENDTMLRFVALWQPTATFEAKFDITSTQRSPNYASADVLYDVVETQPRVLAYNNAGFTFTDESDAFGKNEEYRNSSLYGGPGWIYDSTSSNLTLTWNISDILTLQSITGGRNIDHQYLADLDASRYQFFEIFNANRIDEISQEFQLTGAYDRLDWVVGLYISETEGIQRQWNWQGVEALNRVTNFVGGTTRQDTAVFAEATYDFTDRFSFTAGVRYTEEDFEGGQWDAVEPTPTWPNLIYTFGKGAARSQSAASFSAVTPRLSAQYDWTDDIMTYVTYSEGFNGGGVNTRDFMGEFIAYDGERLNQFEIGFRSDLLDNSLRFNAAYFSGIWDDIQVGEALIPGRIITQNAGEAEISGFEVDIAWAVTNSFQVNFAGGVLDTEYTELGQTQNISLGSEFALAPETQFSAGAQYDWFTADGSTITLRGDYGWTSDFVTIQDTRLQKRQEEYGLLSGRLAYSPVNTNWTIALWGRNLTDEWYQQGGFGAFLGGVDQGVVARPREYGLTVNMEF